LPKQSIWLGIVLAVALPAMVLPLLALASSQAISSIGETLTFVVLFFIYTAMCAVLPTFLLGVPYVLWLHSRNALTLISTCLGAAVIGAISFATISWLIGWSNPVPGLAQFVVGAGFGLLGGVGFWLGSGPNKSFNPTPLRG